MTGPLPFQLDPETGLATIHVAGGRLVGVGWDVRLARGGLGALARVLDVQSDATGGVVRWCADEGLEGEWHLGARAEGAVTARLVVTNRGPRVVALTSLEPVVILPARGGVVALPGAPSSWRGFDPGFQSWSPARTQPLGARWPAPRAAVVRTMSVHPWRADPRRAGWHVHDGAAGLYAGEAGFLVGVLQPRGLHAEIEVDARGAVSLRARSVVEGLPLHPGETRESGEFVVLPGTPEDTWARWASELGSTQGARTSAPAPVGWCSWYDYYTLVTEAVPAHGVALLHVVPVGDAPRLVGGDVHVGLAELEAEDWDGATNTLALSLRLPGERKGSYWVHLGAQAQGEPRVEGARAEPVPGRPAWDRLDMHLVDQCRCTVCLPPVGAPGIPAGPAEEHAP